MATNDLPAERVALDATGTGTWSWCVDRPGTFSVCWAGTARPADVRTRIDDENWHILESRLQEALLEERPFQASVPMGMTDGETRMVHIRGAPLAESTDSPRVVGLCWPDGADEQNDRQAQWAPLAKLSHELRSPIAVVLGLLNELAQATDDANACQALDAAHESCEYMSRIIDDMLTAYRAGEPDQAGCPEPMSTDGLLAQVVPITRRRAAQKGLDVDLWRDAAFPARFLAEPVALRRILQNLLDNAVKYTDNGKIALRLEVSPDDDGTWLCFDVVDTGPGMSDDELEHAFEPFSRGDDGQRRVPGLGIGLSLCRQLAALLDGHLEVDSTPGEGSRFRLRIPARVPEEVARLPADAEIAVVPEGRRVLVVDDHPLLAKLTGRSLARLGCDVDVAGSGRDALALVEGRAPEVMIIDLDLPDVSGWELCRQLSARKHLSDCRFVAYSGSEDSRDEAAMQRAGFDAFFVKPASPEKLLGG